jgi:thiosulfate dehydrogenase
MEKHQQSIDRLTRSLQISVAANIVLVLAAFAVAVIEAADAWPRPKGAQAGGFTAPDDRIKPDSMTLAISRELSMWVGPSLESLPDGEDADLIRYGRNLVARTADYLGPKGSVSPISNGMNCQNCHLDAGTKPWGNNYGAVAATYPKFRHRSGSEEDINKRINDCVERSLNGKALDANSRELKAIASYINWVGHEQPKGEIPNGSGVFRLPFLKRAADPSKGQMIYDEKCASCHGTNGQGVLDTRGVAYTYPPLWGPNSYNHGAGLYRLSMFAGYVKYNMPLGVGWPDSQLSDEACWDVAAYVNTRPRPGKDLSGDWPDITGKPIDHPFGPYADGFSENQHKFGPFEPIAAARKAGKPSSSK